MKNIMAERLERIVDCYIKLIDKTVEDTGDICRNYQHITRNVLTPMQALADTAKVVTDKNKLKQIRHDFIIELKELKAYLKLIKDFPDFGKEEFKKGYFKDEPLNPHDYVYFAYEKLMGKPLKL